MTRPPLRQLSFLMLVLGRRIRKLRYAQHAKKLATNTLTPDITISRILRLSENMQFIIYLTRSVIGHIVAKLPFHSHPLLVCCASGTEDKSMFKGYRWIRAAC